MKNIPENHDTDRCQTSAKCLFHLCASALQIPISKIVKRFFYISKMHFLTELSPVLPLVSECIVK